MLKGLAKAKATDAWMMGRHHRRCTSIETMLDQRNLTVWIWSEAESLADMEV